MPLTDEKYFAAGGSAFPIEGNGNLHPHAGITVRDWFAGQSDIPWNAVIDGLAMLGELRPTVERVVEYRAKMKYLEADAMLKAREA
jgi:hypothetical protein